MRREFSLQLRPAIGVFDCPVCGFVLRSQEAFDDHVDAHPPTRRAIRMVAEHTLRMQQDTVDSWPPAVRSMDAQRPRGSKGPQS